jgi:hypothetical protein
MTLLIKHTELKIIKLLHMIRKKKFIILIIFSI